MSDTLNKAELQKDRADKNGVIVYNNEIYVYKNSGFTRHVYANEDKTKVIKVPVEMRGAHWNETEIAIWDEASYEKRQQLAYTELLPMGWIQQEYLHTLDDESTESWLGRILTMEEIRFASSCRNDVGFDADGNLKCFDLHEYKNY